MRFLFCILVAVGGLASVSALADDAANMPCVEVQIGQDRAAQLDCLNAAFRRQVQRERDAPLPQAPITARSSSNTLGLFNDAAAQQMMGSAYGVSAKPQRPRTVFTSPLVPANH